MFYCEKCRQEKEWPDSIRVSYAKCEICGELEKCYHRPSSSLPKPKTAPKETTLRERLKLHIKRMESRRDHLYDNVSKYVAAKNFGDAHINTIKSKEFDMIIKHLKSIL